MGRTGIGHRAWRWGGGLFLAAGTALWAFWPRPIEVELATSRTGRFEQTIQQEGRLRSLERFVVSAPVSGELVRPTLKVGDEVQAGQQVLTLLPAASQMIDARMRQVLQERAGSADAAEVAARAQAGRAEAALAVAVVESERAQRLAEADFLSASARDRAMLELKAQRMALDAALAQLDQAAHLRAEARAALQRAQSSSSMQGAWRINAPLRGRVVRLHRESATPVTVGEPLLEIADTSRVEAVVDVLSSDALRVRPGMPASLSLGGNVPPVPALVTRIEPVAFTKVSALGIEEQRVNLIIGPTEWSVPGAGEGFRVDAAVTVALQDAALIVPTGALVRNGSGWAVWAAENGRARLRPVDLADRNADLAWLRGGLEPNQPVIVYPDADLGEGQRIVSRHRRSASQ